MKSINEKMSFDAFKAKLGTYSFNLQTATFFCKEIVGEEGR